MAESAPEVTRRKYWSEIDSEEKVERLRGQVKYLSETVIALRETIYKLQQHSHAQDNMTVLVPLNKEQIQYRTILNDGDDVYF